MTRRQIIALGLYVVSVVALCTAAVAYPRDAENVALTGLAGFLTLFALAVAVADTEWDRSPR